MKVGIHNVSKKKRTWCPLPKSDLCAKTDLTAPWNWVYILQGQCHHPILLHCSVEEGSTSIPPSISAGLLQGRQVLTIKPFSTVLWRRAHLYCTPPPPPSRGECKMWVSTHMACLRPQQMLSFILSLLKHANKNQSAWLGDFTTE